MIMATVQPVNVDGTDYFSMTDGARYMNMSPPGFLRKVRRLGIQQYDIPALNANSKYVKKTDLDDLMKPRASVPEEH